MSDENENPKKEDPETAHAVDDLKRGVSLLLRAAKTAAQKGAHRAKDVAHAEKVENAFKNGLMRPWIISDVTGT